MRIDCEVNVAWIPVEKVGGRHPCRWTVKLVALADDAMQLVVLLTIRWCCKRVGDVIIEIGYFVTRARSRVASYSSFFKCIRFHGANFPKQYRRFEHRNWCFDGLVFASVSTSFQTQFIQLWEIMKKWKLWRLWSRKWKLFKIKNVMKKKRTTLICFITLIWLIMWYRTVLLITD